ncbi:translation initiation factor [Lithospermum erythrorhizon]|uniref:Serine-threonine kinase receptor-associated protein n=1 Tax=Lithospermum erythrorhizon TaxID=34254 RepID=A0AAV3RHC8_LITER
MEIFCPNVWFADNGQRFGTYRGHNDVVWTCDVSRDSTRLMTGSADQTAKLWDVKSGTQLFSFDFKAPARAVEFAFGDKLAVITTDPFMGETSAIHVKRIAGDLAEPKTLKIHNIFNFAETPESVIVIKGTQGRITRATFEPLNFGPLNKTIVSVGEDATVRVSGIPRSTGKLIKESDEETGQKQSITSLFKSMDGSHFITGSLDKSAKLWDIRTLTVLKTYVTAAPVNAVTMSPLLNHVVLGDGQDARIVTTTDRRAGMFEAKFYDKILEQKIGEDGYVRLHHFDQDYFNIKI